MADAAVLPDQRLLHVDALASARSPGAGAAPPSPDRCAARNLLRSVIVLVLAGIVGGYVIAGVDAEDTFGQTDAYEAPQSDDEKEGDEPAGTTASALRICGSCGISCGLSLRSRFWPRTKVDRPGRPGPPASAAWVLVPLSVLPFGMQEDVLGPDTSDRVLPAPAVIGLRRFLLRRSSIRRRRWRRPDRPTRPVVAGTVGRQPDRLRCPCRRSARHRQRGSRGHCGMDGELRDGRRVPRAARPALVPRVGCRIPPTGCI